MKEGILVSALVMILAFAGLAVESDPANTVGFTRGLTPFMLPFNYYQPGLIGTTDIDSIIGDQAADGVELWSQQSGNISFYFTGTWYSPYPLINTDAYWYNIS